MKKTQICFIAIILLTFSSSIVAQNREIFQKKFIKARMLKVADWQLKNPNHEPNDWTNGAFYAGVFAAYETTKSPEIWNALMELGKQTDWQPGKRFDHADDIVIAQTYIDVYGLKKDQKMIQPTIDVAKRLQTESGNEVAKHGITWWWCDALFMAPPTLAKLSKTTGDGKREANGKKIFWSRGNGWVLGGLARLLSELPKDYPQRNFYENLYKEMAAKVITLQQTDGLWRSSLLDPDSYPGGEASGSGFYTYALSWGINQKLLDKKKYLPAVKKAWTGLNTLVHEDGKVGWTQPIGADPRKNFNAESWEVYGAGAYLLAGSEITKLKIN